MMSEAKSISTKLGKTISEETITSSTVSFIFERNGAGESVFTFEDGSSLAGHEDFHGSWTVVEPSPEYS